MAGTKAGAAKAKKTITDKYGADFYTKLAAKGGKAKTPGYFGSISREEVSRLGKQGSDARWHK